MHAFRPPDNLVTASSAASQTYLLVGGEPADGSDAVRRVPSEPKGSYPHRRFNNGRARPR